MKKMDLTRFKIKLSKIKGVCFIYTDRFSDKRGTIKEVFRYNSLVEKKSFNSDFVVSQITHTRTHYRGLRGLHYQEWARIIYPVNGSVFNVLVDTRKKSKTFGKVETVVINDKNRIAIYVPADVANGYCVISKEPVDYFYILDDVYDGRFSKGIFWNDPYLKISWPIKNPIISAIDQNNKLFKDL